MSPILWGWPTHGRLPEFLEYKASHVPFLSHERMNVGKIQEEGFPSHPTLVIWSPTGVSKYITEVLHPHRVAGILQHIYGSHLMFVTRG